MNVVCGTCRGDRCRPALRPEETFVLTTLHSGARKDRSDGETTSNIRRSRDHGASGPDQFGSDLAYFISSRPAEDQRP